MSDPNSDLPVYKKEDGWKFHGVQGWSSPPAPLDVPFDQTPQIGEAKQVSGMSFNPLGQASEQLDARKDTVAHPQIGLRATFALRAAQQPVDDTNPQAGFLLTEKDFSVSLQNTHIIPRPGVDNLAAQDGKDHTGWYVDQIDVEMGFDEEPDGLELVSSAPPTVSLTGSIESSVSRSLSAGFFGETATGSASQTWSNSFSYSLQDFGTVNNSSQTKVEQRIQMQVSKGGAYEKPEDLIGPFEFFAGQDRHTLYELPPKAISRLDLGCQGLWVVPGEFRATLPFVIKITPRFVNIQFRQKFGDEGGNPAAGGANFMWAIEKVPVTLTWRLNVDFSTVGYSK